MDNIKKSTDLGTLLGLFAGVSIIFIGIKQSGGSLYWFFNLNSILIVVGGTFAATMVNLPLKALKNLPKILGNVFRADDADYNSIIEEIVLKAQKAKKARRDTSQTVKKKADLKTVLNNHIFPFNKFVLKQHLKDITDGSIGFEIMNQLGLEMKEMPNFWAWHHSEVENCFQEYRSGAQQQMKNSFFDGRNFNFNFITDTFSLTFPFQQFLNSLGQYARWKM